MNQEQKIRPNHKPPSKTSEMLKRFASMAIDEIFEEFDTSPFGISEIELQWRLEQSGYNEPARRQRRTVLVQILSKFANPLVIVLIIIGVFSYFFGEKISALLVSLMVFLSVMLSFIQEYRSNREAEKLSELVRATSTVVRDGEKKEIKMREIVPGDIIDLYAGDMIPADLRILSSKDLFINQASLTGESFPIEKTGDSIQPKNGSVLELTNIVFMGSSVVSGTGIGVVVATGLNTQFGELSARLARIHVQTSFDKGLHQFVWLMIRFMIVLVIIIFSINAFLKGNVVEAFLFSIAVAVGLTPEMLPMIVTINLSKGAIAMSEKKVIVKRLNSIQNLGAMDVVCTDKTGTLTLDEVVLERYCDVIQKENPKVLELSYLNSHYQTGLKNLLDRAILKHQVPLTETIRKDDEIPFDFSRKIMSVVLDREGHHQIISKGAPEEIFKRCNRYELEDEIFDMENWLLADLREEYESLSSEGFRVLAVAYKDMDEKKSVYSRDDEKDLILKGYLAFLDPPKPTAADTIRILNNLGVDVKVLTGDNERVTKKICSDVGLNVEGLVTGDKVEKMEDLELRELVKTTTVFARLAPLQKERVIHALHENGKIVGFLGDGINDAPALKASDVGISVNNAVDIAKESADIILLEKNLLVLEDGVVEGRRTFGNIIKYVKLGASSNLGNMISMTGASLLLPFLPMTPIQILLNNFLYDMSQVSIATDEVDPEYLSKPRRWNVKDIRKFMLIFGPVSSLFDFVTFGVLLFLFKSSAPFFHTGWFLESLISQTLVIHVIRTAKIPFLQSRPSKFLVLTSLFIAGVGLFIPISHVSGAFGFVKLPGFFYLALFCIIFAYMFLAQIVKSWYVKKFGY